MSRSSLDDHFGKIDDLVAEINTHIGTDQSYAATKLRADLAGLLVVAIAATYETCVKDILYEHANRKHADFGEFAQRNFERLNSKINTDDLTRYCKLYGSTVEDRFKSGLKDKKGKLLIKTGTNIEHSYNQILKWRHDFAHAWNRNTTIEEAIKTHVAAKRVLYMFDRSMCPN